MPEAYNVQKQLQTIYHKTICKLSNNTLLTFHAVPATLDQRKDTFYIQTYTSATDPTSRNKHLNDAVLKRGVGGRGVSL